MIAAKKKRWWGVGVGGALASAIVLGAALSPGNSAVDTDIAGGGVWVANGDQGLVGSVNTLAGVVESIVEPDGNASEVLQSEDGIVVIDRAASTMRVLDPATGETGPSVPIDAGADVQLYNDTIAVVSPRSGDVWMTSLDKLRSGTAIGEPILELGQGAALALSEDVLFAASPGLGQVLTVDVATGETVATDDASMSVTEPELQLTAVGDTWVLFDAGVGVLSSDGWSTRLDVPEVALQQPGPSADTVVLATNASVLRYRMGFDTVENLDTGFSGLPARPLVQDGCALSAWSTGTLWRECEPERTIQVTAVPEDPQLTFLERDGSVVLSDPASGNAWLVGTGANIHDWELEVQPEPQGPESGDDEQTSDPEEAQEFPPVAVDDDLGARAGRVTMLPVLLNDSDPNGDALTIIEAIGDNVQIAENGRALRLELSPEATGSIQVNYSITDGNGGSASAVATVTVATENRAPVQEQLQSVQIAPRGEAVVNALEYWVDPDGDPLVLLDAAIETDDDLSFRSDGRLVITDGGAGTVRDISILVSDGSATTEGTLTIAPIDTPQLVADPITVTTYVGQTATIEPLLSVRGGVGNVRLHNVNPPNGMLVTPNYVGGEIAVTPGTSGTTSFTYVVTDGSTTATGEIRVLALDAVDASTPPVTVPHTVAVLPDGSAEVPVAEFDIDPSGGVLLVTALDPLQNPNVQLDVIDQRSIRVQLTGPLEGPVTAGYTVSNGVSASQGTLTIVEKSATASLQAPIARDDSVRVRPGGAIDINVLSNDEHPDGATITLAQDLVTPASEGLLFVDGDHVRFVAPQDTTSGTVTATYEISGPDGQTDTADVTVVIAEADPATNAAPTPPIVDARVVAGETVDIPIDLTSADPNGDAVVLIGQSSPASLGTITQVDQSLQYTAGPYSVGTDVISYVVADELGARAEGTIRVGVSGTESLSAPPVVVGDTVVMRPNSTLAVDVLANDADPAGLALEVASAEPDGDIGATVDDNSVIVTAPSTPGQYGVVVTVENSRGSNAVGWLRVDVADDATPPPPVAHDVTVPLEGILDREAVTVDISEATTIADGATDQLSVSMPLALDGVSLDGTDVEVDVQERTRIVPYSVTRRDTGAVATALIVVPGSEDSLPQLRADVEPIVVDSGASVDIDLRDYIVSLTGTVILTDASSVVATHADSGQRVVDANTVRFTSAPGYFGPADISFTVTDATSPTDPDGRTVPIVLPILVTAGDEVPGRVLGATIQLEPGQQRTLDLSRITSSPSEEALATYSWAVEGAVPENMSATVSGQELTVVAGSGAASGISEDITVGVSDPNGAGVSGTVTVAVISSTRPLVSPVMDAVNITRGTTETVDVLANDQATNPFPDQPLTVGNVNWSTLPNGISVRQDPDSSTLTISASPTAVVGSVTVRYQVLDATGDARRAVWGIVRVSIQDVPDRPAPVVQVIDQYQDGALIVRITPPAENNSPITNYVVTGPGGFTFDCGRQTTCVLTGLEVGVDVQLRVTAYNAIGASAASDLSDPMHADLLPPPVSGITVSPTSQIGNARVSWAAVSQPQGGTPISGYIVRVTGPGVDQRVTVSAGTTSANVGGLQPGEAYRADVAATNDAGVANDAWRFSASPVDFTAVGVPGTSNILYSGNPQNGSVSANWQAMAPNGTTSVGYTVSTIFEGQQPPACRSSGNGRPIGQTSLNATVQIPQGESVLIVVAADNGWFCSTSVSSVVVGKPDPVDPRTVSITMSEGGGSTGYTARNALDMLFTTTRADFANLQVQIVGTGAPEGWISITAAAMWLTPSPGTVAYGETYTARVRVCTTENAGVVTCSDPTELSGTFRPIALQATLNGSCVPATPLNVQLPVNRNSSTWSTTVDVSFLVNGTWTDRAQYGGTPVPLTATSVRLWGVVDTTPREDQGQWSDPVPTTASCSTP